MQAPLRARRYPQQRPASLSSSRSQHRLPRQPDRISDDRFRRRRRRTAFAAACRGRSSPCTTSRSCAMSVALAMLVVVRDPLVLRLLGRLDLRQAVGPQMADAVGDPLDLLLQAGGHVAQRRRRRERRAGGEEVGVAVDLQAHAWCGSPGSTRPSASDRRVRGCRCASARRCRRRSRWRGPGRRPRGPCRRRSASRLGMTRSIGLSLTSTSSTLSRLEGLEVVRLQRHPVGAEAVGGRDQLLAQLGVLEPRAHLVAHELRDLLVDLLVEEHLGERGRPRARASRLPTSPPGPPGAARGVWSAQRPYVEVVVKAGEGLASRGGATR